MADDEDTKRNASRNEPTHPDYVYRQSQRGTLVARLIDGEPREPWELLRDPLDPDDERRHAEGLARDEYRDRARELLDALADMFEVGSRDELERIELATRVLQGIPSSVNDRLAWYVDLIERYARQVQDPSLPDNFRSVHGFRQIRDLLARYHDAAFSKLDPEYLRDEVESIDLTSTGRTPGLYRVAAEIAVTAEAFESGCSGTFEERVSKLLVRLKTARSRRQGPTSGDAGGNRLRRP